jgi:hypothetical protein
MHTSELDLGTAEAWARHQRKMRTEAEVSRIMKILRASRSVWCKVVRRGHDWHAQIGNLRDGVRVA